MVANTPSLIAVLDDEESVRRAIQRLLRSAGFEVLTFASGDEFFKAFDTVEPACLVLDLHMPVPDGFEIQSRLRQMKSSLPVIVLTGHDSPQSRDRVMNAGASAFLRKPVDGQALLDAIAAASQRPEL